MSLVLPRSGGRPFGRSLVVSLWATCGLTFSVAAVSLFAFQRCALLRDELLDHCLQGAAVLREQGGVVRAVSEAHLGEIGEHCVDALRRLLDNFVDTLRRLLDNLPLGDLPAADQ